MTGVVKAEVYRDAAREYRWRLRCGGRIIAESGEGYRRRSQCLHGLRRATCEAARGAVEKMAAGMDAASGRAKAGPWRSWCRWWRRRLWRIEGP